MYKYFDAHAHLNCRPGSTENLLAAMDANEIEKAVVVAGGTISPELLSLHFSEGGSADVAVDNETLRSICQGTAGRLIPFFFANPLHDAGVLEYQSVGKNYAGLKLAPIVHGIPHNNERVHKLVEIAEKFSHPLYTHCLPQKGFRVGDLAQLAAQHPGAKIILGHGGVGHGDFQGISEIKPYPNVFFEISGTFTHAARIAIQVLGASRVLFGTEYPLQDPRVEIVKLDCLKLSSSDRERVARENILQLLQN
jgi:uncharacterized protein